MLYSYETAECQKCSAPKSGSTKDSALLALVVCNCKDFAERQKQLGALLKESALAKGASSSGLELWLHCDYLARWAPSAGDLGQVKLYAKDIPAQEPVSASRPGLPRQCTLLQACARWSGLYQASGDCLWQVRTDGCSLPARPTAGCW